MKLAKGAYGLGCLVIVLVLAVSVLPWIRKRFARSFPEGFRDTDCEGVNCKEGEFCQQNVCHQISPAYTNSYFPKSA